MTPASLTGERVGFVSLKRFLLMETGDVFVHKPYDAHSMITKVGYHRVRVWLGGTQYFWAGELA